MTRSKSRALRRPGGYGRVAVVGLILAGLVAALTPCASTVFAAEAVPVRPVPSDLALVPPDALAVVHVRVADLLQSEIGKAVRQFAPEEMLDALRELETLTGTGLDEMDRLTVVVTCSDLFGRRKSGRDAEPGPVLIVRTLQPYNRASVLRDVPSQLRQENYRGKSIDTFSVSGGRPRAMHFVDDHVRAVAEDAGLLRPLLRQAARPQPEGLLSPALAAAAQKHLVVAGVSPMLASTFSFSGPFGFQERMMMWTTQHTAGVEGITMVVDSAGSKVQASVELAFSDERWARWALPAARTAMGMGRDCLAEAVDELREGNTAVLARVLGQVENAVADARPEQVGTTVRATVAVDISPELIKTALAEAAAEVKQAADKVKSVNNLRQIGLGMLNAESARGRLPAAITDEQGKPLLSWRVAILPYLEQGPLYDQFRLDEPWDSEHNKKLLEKMPSVYALPGVKTKEPFTTFYQGFAGPGTVFGNPKGISMAQIRDGTSNTLMVVEAGEPVPWTKPADLPYDPQKPLPKLGGLSADGFAAIACDGSVHFLRRDYDPVTLRRAITIDDGLPIDWERLTLSSRTSPRSGTITKVEKKRSPSVARATEVYEGAKKEEVWAKATAKEVVTVATEARPARQLDLSYVTDDFFGAVVLHPQQMARSPAVAAALKGEHGAAVIQSAITEFGVDPLKIEEVQLLFSIPRDGPEEPSMVLRLTAPTDADNAARRLVRLFGEPKAPHSIVAATVAGKNCYHFERDAGLSTTVTCVADERTVLVCARGEAGLKKMLAGGAAKGLLAERLRRLDADDDMVAVFTLEPTRQLLKENLSRDQQYDRTSPGIPFSEMLVLAQVATVKLNLADASRSSAVLEATDAEGAARIAEQARLFRARLRAEMENERSRMGNAPEEIRRLQEESMSVVERLLDAMALRTSGSRMIVTVRGEKALLGEVFAKAFLTRFLQGSSAKKEPARPEKSKATLRKAEPAPPTGDEPSVEKELLPSERPVPRDSKTEKVERMGSPTTAAGASAPPSAIEAKVEEKVAAEKPGAAAAEARPARRPDLTYVTADHCGAVVFHPQQMARSPEMAAMLKNEQVVTVLRHLGFDPLKIDEMLVLVPSPASGPVAPSLVLRFSAPVDADSVARIVLGRSWLGDKVVAVTVAGKKCYKFQAAVARPNQEGEGPVRRPKPRPVVTCVADDRTVLVCQRGEADLERMLAGGEVKSPLVERLRRLDASEDIVAVVGLEPMRELIAAHLARGKTLPQPPSETAALDILSRLRGATIKLNLSDAARSTAVLEAEDAADAAKVDELLKTCRQEAKAEIDKLRCGPSDIPEEFRKSQEEAMSLANRVLDAMTWTKNAAQVTIALKGNKGLLGEVLAWQITWFVTEIPARPREAVKPPEPQRDGGQPPEAEGVPEDKN